MVFSAQNPLIPPPYLIFNRAGFTALKMNATSELRRVDTPGAVQAAADRLAEVRDHVGPDIDTGVDFHGRVSKPMAKQLARALE